MLSIELAKFTGDENYSGLNLCINCYKRSYE